MPVNYYEILEVSPEASQRDIVIKFRELARQYHPDKLELRDRTPANKAADETKIRLLNEAKTVLCDPDLRREYDRALAAGRDYDPNVVDPVIDPNALSMMGKDYPVDELINILFNYFKVAIDKQLFLLPSKEMHMHLKHNAGVAFRQDKENPNIIYLEHFIPGYKSVQSMPIIVDISTNNQLFLDRSPAAQAHLSYFNNIRNRVAFIQDVDQVDGEGNTLLIKAIERSHLESTSPEYHKVAKPAEFLNFRKKAEHEAICLVDAGADIKRLDKHGKNAIEYFAQYYEGHDVAKEVRKKGEGAFISWLIRSPHTVAESFESCDDPELVEEKNNHNLPDKGVLPGYDALPGYRTRYTDSRPISAIMYYTYKTYNDSESDRSASRALTVATKKAQPSKLRPDHVEQHFLVSLTPGQAHNLKAFLNYQLKNVSDFDIKPLTRELVRVIEMNPILSASYQIKKKKGEETALDILMASDKTLKQSFLSVVSFGDAPKKFLTGAIGTLFGRGQKEKDETSKAPSPEPRK